MVCSSHIVSAAPSSSAGGLLTLCPCSNAKSLSREIVLHELLQIDSFPRVAALHELPQRGCFLWGAVLQEQAAPTWVPHGVTSPARKPAPVWAPLSMGLQVLAGACSSACSPWGHSLPSGIHLLRCGVPSTGSIVDLHGLQGNNLPHHGEHESQGKALCSGILSTSSPLLSSLTLESAALFLSLHLTPLSNCHLTTVIFSSFS